jgi:hypothetical protein
MCSTPLRIGRRHDDPTRTSNRWFSSPNFEPRRLEEQGKKMKAQRAVAAHRSRSPGLHLPLPHNEMLGQNLLSFELWINNPIVQSNDCSESECEQ